MKYQVFYQSIVSLIHAKPLSEIQSILKSKSSFSLWLKEFQKTSSLPCDVERLYTDLLSFFVRICPQLLIKNSTQVAKQHDLEVML